MFVDIYKKAMLSKPITGKIRKNLLTAATDLHGCFWIQIEGIENHVLNDLIIDICFHFETINH